MTNAAYLAKAGLRTLVLERRNIVGGAAITEELYPGHWFTSFSYALSLLRPDIIQELELVKRKLEVKQEEEENKASSGALVTADKSGFQISSPDRTSFRLRIRGYAHFDSATFLRAKFTEKIIS